MTASLPMYARPETAAAQQAFWRQIRQAAQGQTPDARVLPETLRMPDDLMAHWRDPELVFSQTCGLPFRKHLHDHVALLATPDFALPGCPPGHYNSVLVMRAADGRSEPDWPGMTLALNGFDSQSGWAAPWAHAAARGLQFGGHLATGAHRASARAVLEGRADIAAIDAQTWRMMRRWDTWTGALREAAFTEPTPGLPYITARDRRALQGPDVAGAFDRLAAADRAVLDLAGIVFLPADAYTALPLPPNGAKTG